MNEHDMVRLIPSLKDFLWGGTRLKEEFGKNCDLEKVAESWELSVHRSGESIVAQTGQPLSAFLKEHPGFLGKEHDSLDILIKFIDARDNLSLQVHPDEKYANENENQHGKTEMWYIIDASEDASIIFGMKDQLTREQFRQAISDNTILEHVNCVPVRKGDYCLIQAGTLHAVGRGCLIAEIQQSSDVTYRVYDYDRRDKDGNPRQLHIEKAIDVTNLVPFESGVRNTEGRTTVMADNELFTVVYHPMSAKLVLKTSPASFTAVIFTDGSGSITHGSLTRHYTKGDTWLISAGDEDIVIQGSGECLQVTVR